MCKKHDESSKQNKKLSIVKNIETIFYCNCCNFLTTNKKEANKHYTSNLHTTDIIEEEIFEIIKRHKCIKCDKRYEKYKSCWEHSKRCSGNNEKIVTEQIETPTEITEKPKKEKSKKKIIPLALKRNVWNKHIGEEIGKTLCLCCKLTDISQMNFSCGHIISENNGGEINLNNLKPICVSCNSSMGTKNMDEFIQNYGL
jgi:5-methylcytosine-specific restriction endonuclease McrA